MILTPSTNRDDAAIGAVKLVAAPEQGAIKSCPLASPEPTMKAFSVGCGVKFSDNRLVAGDK